MSETCKYTVLVLFGSEAGRRIVDREVFTEVADLVARLLSLSCPDLKARGSILVGEGKKKNVAPRQGPWSQAMRDRYLEAMRLGSFRNLELFDAAWGEGRHPDAYGAISKLWGRENRQDTERTRLGAENNVTVAIREDFVEGAFERLKSAAKSLIPMIDCIFGSIETGIPWDQDSGYGTFIDMIDARVHARTRDYWEGYYRVKDGVPRLYRGNILSPLQLARPDPQAMTQLPGVTSVEQWPNGLIYLELGKQPEFKAKIPPQFKEFIKFFDPEVNPHGRPGGVG